MSGEEPARDSVCTDCARSYECSILATALGILDAMPEFAEPTARRTALERVRAVLASLGFNYPDSKAHCSMHENGHLILGMTQELVKILRGERDDRRQAKPL